jgi:hypothetical protein
MGEDRSFSHYRKRRRIGFAKGKGVERRRTKRIIFWMKILVGLGIRLLWVCLTAKKGTYNESGVIRGTFTPTSESAGH